MDMIAPWSFDEFRCASGQPELDIQHFEAVIAINVTAVF